MEQIKRIIAEIEGRIGELEEERNKMPPTTPKSVDRLLLGARIATLEETLDYIKSLPAAVDQPNNEKEFDPFEFYSKEELSILRYVRDIPDEAKDTMSKLAEDL